MKYVVVYVVIMRGVLLFTWLLGVVCCSLRGNYAWCVVVYVVIMRGVL